MQKRRIPHIKNNRKRTLKEIHDYWKDPDKYNTINNFIENDETINRSQLLLKLFNEYVHDKSFNILELGCNIGRNLNFLYKNGYYNLSGIEINNLAIKSISDFYPKMYNKIRLYNDSIENSIKSFNNDEFDVMYTMAILEHIHPSSEWIFHEISRITKYILITIEDELGVSYRHFPRNYKDIFENLEMKQIFQYRCSHKHGLDTNFFVRVFKHA